VPSHGAGERALSPFSDAALAWEDRQQQQKKASFEHSVGAHDASARAVSERQLATCRASTCETCLAINQPTEDPLCGWCTFRDENGNVIGSSICVPAASGLCSLQNYVPGFAELALTCQGQTTGLQGTEIITITIRRNCTEPDPQPADIAERIAAALNLWNQINGNNRPPVTRENVVITNIQRSGGLSNGSPICSWLIQFYFVGEPGYTAHQMTQDFLELWQTNPDILRGVGLDTTSVSVGTIKGGHHGKKFSLWWILAIVVGVLGCGILIALGILAFILAKTRDEGLAAATTPFTTATADFRPAVGGFVGNPFAGGRPT